VEVVELFVQFHILGHCFCQNRHPLNYPFGVSVKEVVCREKMWTKDEISPRNMNFAAIASNNQKETENLRSQPSGFDLHPAARHQTAAASRGGNADPRGWQRYQRHDLERSAAEIAAHERGNTSI
jgi:hypothetical protein